MKRTDSIFIAVFLLNFLFKGVSRKEGLLRVALHFTLQQHALYLCINKNDRVHGIVAWHNQ